MSHILLSLIFAIACSEVCFSMTVTYFTTYKQTSDGPLLTCENTLEISHGMSVFYSKNLLRQAVINDSLLGCGASPYGAIDIWKREKLLRHTNVAVFKHYPVRDSIMVTDKIMYYYSYKEPMPDFKWNYTSGDTIILGHLSHRATTVYRGRKWLVWYSTDFPASDGPWKFCGLPGLILYARDSKGEFSFEVKNIDYTEHNSCEAELFIKKARASNFKEMARLKRLMYWDEGQFDSEVMGKRSQLFDAKGKPLPP